MNADRELVSLSLYDFVGSVNRAGCPVPAEISLDHRYPGVVALWIDYAGGWPIVEPRIVLRLNYKPIVQINRECITSSPRTPISPTFCMS